MTLKKRYLTALLAMAVAALLPSSASASSTVSLVAWGLDSPRGIDFVGSRAVVAESGHGSDSKGGCFPTPFGNTCVGNTSQISWVNTRTGAHSVLAGGFFSIALDPVEVIGVGGLSVRDGKIYAQIGATGRELPKEFFTEQAGLLISVNPRNGSWKAVAPVGNNDFDYTLQFTPPDPATCGQCPGTQEHDANPTGVLATGHGIYVADSGSNTLTKVGKKGQTEVVHYFPWRDPNPRNFPSDEVPTCVTSTDEALWIGTLAGHLFSFADSKVTQVTPRDSAGKPLLSHVTGCTADHNGNLYLVNMFGPGPAFVGPMFANGSVVKYKPDEGTGSVLADAFHNPALFLPYMDKIGPDGNLYVTSGAICGLAGANPFEGAPFNPCTLGDKKGGRVVRITLPRDDDNNKQN